MIKSTILILLFVPILLFSQRKQIPVFRCTEAKVCETECGSFRTDLLISVDTVYGKLTIYNCKNFKTVDIILIPYFVLKVSKRESIVYQYRTMDEAIKYVYILYMEGEMDSIYAGGGTAMLILILTPVYYTT